MGVNKTKMSKIFLVLKLNLLNHVKLFELKGSKIMENYDFATVCLKFNYLKTSITISLLPKDKR